MHTTFRKVGEKACTQDLEGEVGSEGVHRVAGAGGFTKAELATFCGVWLGAIRSAGRDVRTLRLAVKRGRLWKGKSLKRRRVRVMEGMAMRLVTCQPGWARQR